MTVDESIAALLQAAHTNNVSMYRRMSAPPLNVSAQQHAVADAAAMRAHGVFGLYADIRTEPDVDPETGFQRLFVVIETSLPLDTAEPLLRRFENDYWFSAMPADGSVAVELRLV